jgi:archaeosortase A (PGF-CTERM-specific)
LFAVHWLAWTYEYVFLYDNYFNAVFSALAVLFLVFMAYHEYLDYTWHEETHNLKWFAGIIFFCGIVYYSIEYNPYVAAAVIYPVAWLTISVMNGLGLTPSGREMYLDEINFSDPSNVYVPIVPENINIILACTAIQAILIFAAVILFVSAERRKKLKALFVTTFTIYSLNIVRNVATIWLVGTGTTSFYFAHEILGKIFSFIVLIILAFWTFTVLPEILDNFYGFLDLRFRNKPGMIVDGFVKLPAKPKPRSKSEESTASKQSKSNTKIKSVGRPKSDEKSEINKNNRS